MIDDLRIMEPFPALKVINFFFFKIFSYFKKITIKKKTFFE